MLIYTAIKWIIKIYRWIKSLKTSGERLSGKELAAMNQLSWHMLRAANMSVEVGCAPGGVADPNFDENEPFTLETSVMAFHPYPLNFPSDALPILLDAIRGKPVDIKEACHGGWHIVGFGMSKWDVHQGFGDVPALKGEDLASALEAEAAGAFQGDGSIWKGIVQGVMDLIQTLLAK